MDAADLPSSDDAAAPLSRSERTVSGLVGLLAFGAGVAATFVADSEVGAGVLLAIGALFLLMSVTARPVISAKLGDNEIMLARRLIRTVEEKLESASHEARAELAEAVLAAEPAAWRPISQKARWVLFEEELATALSQLLPDAEIEQAAGGRDDIDFRVRHGEVVVGIESKFASRRLNSASVRHVMDRARRSGIDKLLVVASGGFTTGALELQRDDLLQLKLVAWAGEADTDVLARALAEFGIPVISL